MSKITFHSQKTGKNLGAVWVEDKDLRCDTESVREMIENWQGSPQGFIEHYRGWANGYVYTQESE